MGDGVVKEAGQGDDQEDQAAHADVEVRVEGGAGQGTGVCVGPVKPVRLPRRPPEIQK